MKTFVLFTLAFLTQAGLFAQGAETEIRNSFNEFKNAIMNNDGETAYHLVDQSTIDYYSKILDMAKNSDSTELRELNIMDKYNVLLTRARIDAESLVEMGTMEYFTYGIKEGLVAQSGAGKMSLDDIEVNGDTASAQILISGQQTPLSYSFNREDGSWKVDMTSIFPPTLDALNQGMKQSGRTPVEFLSMLITAGGEQYAHSLWHPGEAR